MKYLLLLLLMAVQVEAAVFVPAPIVNDGSAPVDVSLTELGFLDGVTSAIQGQITSKSASFSTSSGLAGLVSDETGSGAAMFGTSPTITTSLTVTNTTSGTSPLVINDVTGGTGNRVQYNVAGVSKFSVTAAGVLTASGTITASGTGISLGNSAVIPTSGTLFWGDTTLGRDAANVLYLRNGVNAQSGRIYTTFTDASNYERLGINTAAGSVTLVPESAGTGSANIDLVLNSKGTGSTLIPRVLTVAKAIQCYQGSLTHAGTVTLDFDAATTVNAITLTGAVTFAASNLNTNRTYRLKITAPASNATPTFPAWNFLGGAPTTITASKVSMLTLEAWGTTDGSVVAAFSEAQ